MAKIGLIQTKTYGSNQIGIREASKMLRVLGGKEADIVCLPEQWLNNNRILDYDLEFSEFKKIAREYGMAVIAGAFYQKKGAGWTISAPVIGPTGDIIGVQEKIHPFDYERKIIRAGTLVKVFKAKFRFGVPICYDMVFSDVAETLVKKGAQVLLSPSRIVRRGIRPWHMYVQVRALENRVPVLASNMQSAKFGGKSIIVDLVEDDKVMLPKAIILSGQSARIIDFDLAKYEKGRKIRYRDHRKFV